MSVHVIVHLSPKDPDKIAAYSAAAGPTVEKFGGKFVGRGPAQVLAGEHGFKMAALLEFPDHDTAVTWYESDEYQALIPNRDEGMDSTFILVG